MKMLPTWSKRFSMSSKSKISRQFVSIWNVSFHAKKNMTSCVEGHIIIIISEKWLTARRWRSLKLKAYNLLDGRQIVLNRACRLALISNLITPLNLLPNDHSRGVFHGTKSSIRSYVTWKRWWTVKENEPRAALPFPKFPLSPPQLKHSTRLSMK